jgi:hypothetical protein
MRQDAFFWSISPVKREIGHSLHIARPRYQNNGLLSIRCWQMYREEVSSNSAKPPEIARNKRRGIDRAQIMSVGPTNEKAANPVTHIPM